MPTPALLRGPPRWAIHGQTRLSRHPCRDAHCAMPAFSHRGLTGRLRSTSKADQEHSGLPAGLSGVKQNQKRARSTVGAGLPAMVVNDKEGFLNECNVYESIAGKPAPTERRFGSCSAFDFDLRRPVKPRWPSAGITQWVNRQERFAYFGLGRHSGCSKVSRCKSTTISHADKHPPTAHSPTHAAHHGCQRRPYAP